MKIIRILPLLYSALILFITAGTVPAVELDSILTRYAAARMINFDIWVVVESDIFGTVDTTHGDITITDDGRYVAYVGGDIYLFDGRCIWEYSRENNQATKDCLEENEIFENELFFIKNLKKYYMVAHEDEDLFLLVRTSPESSQLPDSMTVTTDEEALSELTYYDLNHDLNKVHIKSDSLYETIDREIFEIHLPDTTEIITLP